MNEKCIDIDDLIFRYLNDNLNIGEKHTLFFHLTECKTCMENLVFMTRLHKELMQEVPKDIITNAFSLIKLKRSVEYINHTERILVDALSSDNFNLKDIIKAVFSFFASIIKINMTYKNIEGGI